MGPIVMLLLFGGSAYGAGALVTENGVSQKDLKARIYGVPAVPLLAGIGVISALLASGTWLFPIAAGIASGALVAGRDLDVTREGMEAMVKDQVKKAIAAAQNGGPALPAPPAPPALPGPGVPSPGADPANAPGPGVLSWLLAPFRSSTPATAH